MDEKLTLSIMQQAPFGYAYHKLLINDQGQPEDYVFQDINPAFEKMTGLTKETIIGQKVTDVLPGIRTGGFDWVAFYGAVALQGTRQEFTQYAEPLGRWYKINAFSPCKGCFITIFQDITAEKRQIKMLEVQKQQIQELSIELEMVFNGAQDAMFLIAVKDGEFRYIRNNTSHQSLTGFNQEWLRDKTPVELVGEEIGQIIQANYQKCVEAKKCIAFEEHLTLPAGKKIWLTNLTPLIEEGTVTHLVGSSKDITLQKKAEEEREELFQRLQVMFNGHNAIMLLIEPPTGEIIDANPAACGFYGYSREEILNMHIQDINMLPPQEVENRRRLACQNKQHYFLFPHRLKSGEIKLVDVYSCSVIHGQKTLLFSIIFDMTDKEKYKEDLYREKELFRTTLLSIGDGVVTTDETGRITALNKAAEEITGWSEKEVNGKPFSQIFQLISEVTGKKVEDPVEKVLHSGKIIGLANHTALVNKNGVHVSIADSAAPIRDAAGQIFGAVLVFRDVSAEKKQQEKVLHMSYHDGLTGLYNRRFMDEEISRQDDFGALPVAIIMGDINGLKLSNDVFGHSEGDKLLKKAAALIQENCREADIISRWGGDEFLILLPRTTTRIAEEIIKKIQYACFHDKEGNMRLSIALGCAAKSNPTESLWQVVKEAEECMYRFKLLEGKSYRNKIISTLQATLLEKSIETEKHAERLKHYCLAVGKKFKLSPKELDELALLATLHDIGKVAISENILKKPGPLTSKEWAEMQKHSAIGCRIAQNTPELAPVAEYILAHHERWDGNGYPGGLAGSEIPLLCRILAVADAYDAMTQDRVYRKAMSREDALAEIERNGGTQFDPLVVTMFLRITAEEYHWEQIFDKR